MNESLTVNENGTNVEATNSERAKMANHYGSWYKEGATASDLVSWCDGRIAKYTEWIKNCKALKQSSQTRLVAGMSKEELQAALDALTAE